MARASPRPIWRRAALGAFAVGLVVVAVLLLLPADELPKTNVWDKLEHAGIFAGLTAIGLLAFPERGRSGWLAFSLIVFGSACEMLQMFVPGREATLRDALANAVGVLSVVGLRSLLRPTVVRRAADT